MTKYESGRRIEYKAREELEEEGFYVMRSSGSKGKFDLIALEMDKEDEPKIRLIQIKSVKKNHSFKKEEELMKELADKNPYYIFELWIWNNKKFKKHYFTKGLIYIE